MCNILTSDLAELSNKKLTCVSNRCIRSKMSGDNIDCGPVELGVDATLTEAGAVKQLYNPVPQEVLELGVSCYSWREDAVERTSSQTEGLWSSGLRLSSPAERERNPDKDKGTGGQYVAVFVQSPTHLSLMTLSHPFRIKCERYIFLKNCV